MIPHGGAGQAIESRPIPRGSEDSITAEEIENNDLMRDINNESYIHGRYYKNETANTLITTTRLDPFTRKPIVESTRYTADLIDPPPLPAGWVSQWSARRKAFFFAREGSMVTQWELPVAVPIVPVVNIEDIPVPPGWTVHKSDTHNEIYFKRHGVSQWEYPLEARDEFLEHNQERYHTWLLSTEGEEHPHRPEYIKTFERLEIFDPTPYLYA